MVGTVAAALVLAACGEQSRVDPDATIHVGGVVRHTDGSPVAGRPVQLGAGITDGEGAFAVLTLGLSCQTGECRGAVRDTTTDDNGRYDFTLEGHETQSSFGEAVSILVSATGAPPDGRVSGALVSARFRVQSEQVSMPPLALVEPDLVLDRASDALDVIASWSTDRPAPYDLSFETDAVTPLWRVTTADQGATVDARILEDTAGRVVVAGGHNETIEGSDVAVRWRSAGVGFAAAAGPPPSRGRPCRYLDAAGRHTVASPCALTDGELTTIGSAPQVCADPVDGEPPADCEAPTVVELDLGAAVPAELVVVRGCEDGCAVETTGDGVTYRPVGSVSDDFGAVLLDGQPTTAVRVGLGSSAFGLREVSVWGARPDRPALRPIDDSTRDELGASYGGGADGTGGNGLPWPVVGAAAVAAAAVLIGLGFAAGRRRRR